MARFELSAFADEYSPIFDRQIEGLQENGVGCIEIRGVDGKNISSLSCDEAKNAKNKLESAGIKVSAIGSPIGKIGIYDDFEAHMALFRRTLEIAKIMETENMRIFSFYLPKDSTPDEVRSEVMRRLEKMLLESEKSGIKLCHENEKGIYGDSPERCLDIQNEFGGAIKCVFDPANFIECGYNPYPDAFELLGDSIYYMHIKDAAEDKTIVPAGAGIGHIPEIIGELNRKDFSCFLSVEPHLRVFKGLAELENTERSMIKNQYATSEEAFAAAVAAIKRII